MHQCNARRLCYAGCYTVLVKPGSRACTYTTYCSCARYVVPTGVVPWNEHLCHLWPEKSQPMYGVGIPTSRSFLFSLTSNWFLDSLYFRPVLNIVVGCQKNYAIELHV